mgnify:CR=1 FL=1
MPKNVRNTWVEAKVDGRKTDIVFGPRAKSGGLTMTIWIRDRNNIAKAIDVSVKHNPAEDALQITCKFSKAVDWLDCSEFNNGHFSKRIVGSTIR